MVVPLIKCTKEQ